MRRNDRRVPVWMMVVIIVSMLPVLAFPTLMSIWNGDGEGHKAFLWIYPVYVLASGYLAWQCYGRRSEMSWILIALMLLSHAAIWLLATTPLAQ